MKKYIVSLIASSAVLALAVTFSVSIQSTQAQTVNCPAGYTCAPIVAQPNGCPIGYTCTPVNSTSSNSGYNGSGAGYAGVSGGGYNNSNGCFSYTFSNNLSLGSTGTDVSALQTFLISKGFSIRNISAGWTQKGYFGNQTSSALSAYQASVGLNQTGILDMATQQKINGSCAAGNSSGPTNPITSVSSPVITNVGSPANPSSQFYPGDRVTIVGTGFPVSPTVWIGTTSVLAQSNTAGTNITFYAPTTLSSGNYNLYITGPAIQSNTMNVTVLAANPTPQANATISYVQSPAEYQNVLHSGERATVYGTNLPSSASVYIGSYSTYGQVSAYGNQLTFTVPTISPGTYNLYVTGPAVQTNSISVTIPAANVIPVISYLSQNSAPADNQTRVTISGSNFTNAAIIYLSNSVGSTPIQPLSVSSNSVVFAVPPGMSSGTYNLSVANGNPNGTLSNGISVAVSFQVATVSPTYPVTSTQPTITNVSAPASLNFQVYPGIKFDIQGSYLAGNYITTTYVYFMNNGIKDYATLTTASDNLLWAVAPSDLSPNSSYSLYVSNEKGTSNPVTVTTGGVATTVNPPSITRICAPASGDSQVYAGQKFCVTGTNFVMPDSVYVGNKAAVVTQDGNWSTGGVLYAIAPSDLQSGSNYVTVKNNNGTSNQFSVTVFGSVSPTTNPPTISSFNGKAGSMTVGSVNNVTGQYFTGVTSAYINGPGTSYVLGYTINNDASINLTLPTGVSGGQYSLYLVNSAGTSQPFQVDVAN